jgi:hypothetical protein
VHEKPDWPGPQDRVDRPAQSDRLKWVSAAVDPDFCPSCSFSTSFFGQKILRDVLKRKMRFLGFSSSDYLFGRIGSSGINPFKQYFAPTQQTLCP